MKNVIVIILLFFSIHFFKFHSIPRGIFKFTDLISLLIMGISFVSFIQNENLRFRKPIIFFLVGIVFNILSAYVNNQQGPMDTLLSFGPYYFILFYFFLYDYKIGIKQAENMIIMFAVLYSTANLIQIAVYPKIYFNVGMFLDRGTLRMALEGRGFLILAYFMLLNKYLLKHKVLSIIIAFIFFIVILKAGYRTLAAVIVLLSGVVFLKLLKYSALNYFLVVLAVVGFIGLLQLESTSSIVDGMVNASEDQMDEGDDYIRLQQFRFFTRTYPRNISYYLFGGGLPGGRGSYSNYIHYIQSEYGFYWVDLGLIGFFFVIGGVTTFGLLWYTIKGIFIKVPPEYLYLNIFFAYLLLVSFSTQEIFRPGMFVVQGLALYILDVAKGKLNEVGYYQHDS